MNWGKRDEFRDSLCRVWAQNPNKVSLWDGSAVARITYSVRLLILEKSVGLEPLPAGSQRKQEAVFHSKVQDIEGQCVTSEFPVDVHLKCWMLVGCAFGHGSFFLKWHRPFRCLLQWQTALCYFLERTKTLVKKEKAQKSQSHLCKWRTQ